MNKQHQCPNCGQPLSIQTHIQTATSGTGAAPAIIGGFALGSATNSPTGYKLHRKPIHQLKMEHFAISALVGGLSTLAILGLGSVICDIGIICTNSQNIGIGAILGGLGLGWATLKFINEGRYEIREESQPTAVASSAPKTVATAPTEPAIHRVELKIERPNGSKTFRWFDLPSGIDDKLELRIANCIKANEYHISRRLICGTHNILTDYKYRQLTDIYKDNQLLESGNKLTIVTPLGRSYFRKIIKERSPHIVG